MNKTYFYLHTNGELIEKNASYISIHDRSRIEILQKLHTHKNVGP